MLARSPRGGSLVILTPFWRMETGKDGEGAEVSHSLKSGFVLPTAKSSHIFSSVVIHETARWQFCSTTHEPEKRASEMSFLAMGPWPWPREMELVRLPPKPRDSANLSSSDIGSWPGERMKMSGAAAVESAKQPSRSKGGGSTYWRPRFSSTKEVTMGTTRSGRKQRRMQSLSKATPSSLRSLSHLPGSFCECGWSCSYTCFHSLSCLPKSVGKSSKPLISERRRISSHLAWASHGAPSEVLPSAVGLGAAPSGGRPAPPVRKKVNWSASRLPSPRMRLVHMTKAKRSLSFSYSERHTFL
mmetsp:Transcript_72143/g.143092  ORF Transcript_72143/g.143092 Transcript_72143/m.143092 type:complete len:300 (-) Transcript_72143:2055-2954(-)